MNRLMIGRKPAPEVGDPSDVNTETPLRDPSGIKERQKREDPDQDEVKRRAPRRPPDDGRDGSKPGPSKS